MYKPLEINITSIKKIDWQTRDRISLFLKEIELIELIDPQEEVALSNKIKQGDEKALHTLIRSNLRFVVKAAFKFQLPEFGVSYEDLVSAGYQGLHRAAQKWDPSRGFRFMSYAVSHVAGRMLLVIEKYGRLIRLPSNQINEARKVTLGIDEWKDIELRLEDWKDPIAHAHLCECFWLDPILETKEDAVIIAEPNNGESLVIMEGFYVDIVRAFAQLSPLQRIILISCFGLDNVKFNKNYYRFQDTKDRIACEFYPKYPWREIQSFVGFSRAYCLQKRNDAITKLRKGSLPAILMNYLDMERVENF